MIVAVGLEQSHTHLRATRVVRWKTIIRLIRAPSQLTTGGVLVARLWEPYGVGTNLSSLGATH
jgi:hypothetical protein